MFAKSFFIFVVIARIHLFIMIYFIVLQCLRAIRAFRARDPAAAESRTLLYDSIKRKHVRSLEHREKGNGDKSNHTYCIIMF